MIRKSILGAYALLIIVLSLMPKSGLPHLVLFPNADKVVHLCMYACFTFLLFWAWPDKFKGSKQLMPFVIIAVWGFSMEILQGILNTGRSFDLWDEVANMLGFIPGWLSWRFVTRKTNLKITENK
jgi:hypothetical protein